MVGRKITRLGAQAGSTPIEMALAMTGLAAMMFGMCQTCLAMYYGHFCSDAARQASRYAMVRGSTSCTNTPNLSNCDATATEIQTWVRTLNYPAVVTSNVGVATSWYTASTTAPQPGQTTTWTLCSTGTCNAPGNLVKVVVSYPLTFQIPFSHELSLNLNSTSQMIITQ